MWALKNKGPLLVWLVMKPGFTLAIISSEEEGRLELQEGLRIYRWQHGGLFAERGNGWLVQATLRQAQVGHHMEGKGYVVNVRARRQKKE